MAHVAPRAWARPVESEQRPCRRLPGLGAGDAADLRQAHPHAVPEQRQVLCGHLPRDRAHAAVAGQVGGVDEAAQRVCDLAGPDRARVAPGGVLKIAQQVPAAQLVADPGEGAVVLVAVVRDGRAVQVAVNEALEGGQVPAAQEVTGDRPGAGDLQVLLVAGLRPRPRPQRGLIPADDPGEDDQRPARLVRRRDRPGGAAQQMVHPPVRRPGPRHRPEDARAAFHRDVVQHYEEHAPGLDVQPVADRARRPGRLRRRARHVHPAAGASHLVPVILGSLRPGAGQGGDLVKVRHPEIPRAGQVAPALAPPPGNTSTALPGRGFHARYAPGVPAAVPACASSPAPLRAFRSGGFFPGRSSGEKGTDEFPESREISRSRRATFSSSPAISAPLPSSSTCSRSFASRSRRSPRAARPHHHRAHPESRRYRAYRDYIRAGPP